MVHQGPRLLPAPFVNAVCSLRASAGAGREAGSGALPSAGTPANTLPALPDFAKLGAAKRPCPPHPWGRSLLPEETEDVQW